MPDPQSQEYFLSQAIENDFRTFSMLSTRNRTIIRVLDAIVPAEGRSIGPVSKISIDGFRSTVLHVFLDPAARPPPHDIS